ncbi:hypothetical protein F2P45_23820 [Massilia sp. CCM 8733]|uniref:Uncharacterized protein n=1 Tax=Massilia mucilaginosa TaxID=2609282 RepID=A0ABX0NZJ1_9BURK|nr:hypothetical protein [Massilia mucilaginosa]NHZ92010.1 hypothetical protein [Massilia mucilaginosa]
MSTCFRQLLPGALLTLAAASASATSPCEDPEGCLDKWPVMILILMETQLAYCPALVSLTDAQKEELVQENFKSGGTPGYLARLRATEHYAHRPDIAAQIKEKPELIEEMCKELMIKPK